MNHGRTATCVLCHRSEETKITGNLLTKEQVTAHLNCLLYSSGIFCTDTPQFDDLYGFSVEDVRKEVKRGGKLHCSHCKKKGATAGCEVGRCKKTFHYPCAIEEGAKPFECDEKYGLYCLKHSNPENGSSVHKPKTPWSSKKPSETRSSKETYCLTCEKKEGNISFDSLSNSIVMMYCLKHAPPSQKMKANGDPFASRLSSSCSSDSSSKSLTSTKRLLSFNELGEEDSPSKSKSGKRSRILSDDPSDDEVGLMPPLESDLEESANSVQEHESALPLPIGKDSENPSASSAGLQEENGIEDLNNNEDETFIHSDAESESLLPALADRPKLHSSPAPQTVTDECPWVQLVEKEVQTVKREIDESSFEQYGEHVDGPSVPQQSSPAPDPSPERSKPSSPPPCTSSNISSAPHRPMCPLPRSPRPDQSAPQTPPPSEPSSPLAPPSDPKPDIDSASFWRNCNTAGCTRAIFTEFITEMDNISSRIQCDQASQEDYDRALSVMMASGRLADLVTKHEEELERRRKELERASASLKDVVSALR